MNDCGCDDDDGQAWNAERIASTKALIVAYEAAILALATGAQSYQLDTGQSRQLVSKADLGNLQRTLAWLETRLARKQAEAGCGRQFNVRPGW